MKEIKLDIFNYIHPFCYIITTLRTFYIKFSHLSIIRNLWDPRVYLFHIITIIICILCVRTVKLDE